jgi:hypothetical protein
MLFPSMQVKMTAFYSVAVAVLSGCFIFIVLFYVTWRVESKHPYVTFTPQKIRRTGDKGDKFQVSSEEVDFDPRHGHYLKVAEVIVTLSSASLVLIPTLHFRRTSWLLVFAMVLLGMTVVFAVFFMAFLTYFYENFLYDPRSFTSWKSGLNSALGFSALVCFGLAYLMLAIEIAIAFGAGVLSG